ncbi:homoserine kinase [Kribbella flavida]|uniref:homoserine kinase n=1 Tax=Kribbella flavida TaxID=182640 RepID=UPI0002EA4ACB|nr:homoserine kinase [Kribbella flavida]
MAPAAPVRVRVPATSANLGPGFDAFGLALTLYDELTVTPGRSGVTVEVTGAGAGEVALDESHLVVQAIRAGLESLGATVPGFALRCENRVPHGRGLGSSSAAIVGGIAAAYGLTGTPLDRARVVELAHALEGHPDNVAAAALGGFTIAWTEGDAGRAVRAEPVDGLRVTAYVPQTRVLTKAARGLLPDVVPHGDAAANAGRAALLVTAITARPELLMTATEDRLHQEYREPVMPESLALVHKLRGSGLAAVVSGAGPTVLVLGGPEQTSGAGGTAGGTDPLSGGAGDGSPLSGSDFGAAPPVAPDGWSRHDLGIDPLGVQVWSGAFDGASSPWAE